MNPPSNDNPHNLFGCLVVVVPINLLIFNSLLLAASARGDLGRSTPEGFLLVAVEWIALSYYAFITLR